MSQSPSSSLNVSVAMDTNVGRKREQNQDAIGHMVPADPDVLAQLGRIFVLADGVGGLTSGDLASQYAVSTIISSYYNQEDGDPGERLARAIAEANSLIYAEGHGDDTPGAMATTVVAVVIRERSLIIGSVGDSPAYLLREGHVRQLTHDHTVEQMQREAGQPLADGDPNGRKLVRALGNMPSVKVDIITGPVRDGDYVVLCSDGLTRYVDPEEIERTVTSSPPETAVQTLIGIANERGGADNVSLIVLHLIGEEGDVTREMTPPAMELEWGSRQEADGQDLAVPSPVSPPRSRQAAAEDRQAADSERTWMRQSPLGTARARQKERERRRTTGTVESPLTDLWDLLRSNMVVTGIGMAVLLVLFVVIMLIVAGAVNDDDSGTSEQPPDSTALPAAQQTGTYVIQSTATAQAAARQTTDALQDDEAEKAATSAVLTLTPPAPSGPIMDDDDWFRVLPGEPIPTFEEPDTHADPATPLEAGSAYLIQEVDNDAWNGPWYWVVDNLGVEARWVNGPSLHQRALAITPSGEPLPLDQQPTDLAPSILSPTPPPTLAPSDTPAGTSSPETPQTPAGIVSPDAAPTLTPTITVDYVAEEWEAGVVVRAKAEFLLRQTPSLDGDEIGPVAADETASVLQGPVAADSHWWWRLQYEDGRVGWVAQPLLSYDGPPAP